MFIRALLFFCLISLVPVSVATPAHAIATDEGDWALRWNLVPVPLRAFAVEGDIALGESWSIGPMAAISAKWTKNTTAVQAKALGARLNWWFLGERLMTGFLLSAFAEGISLTLTEQLGAVQVSGAATVGHVGILAAFHWRIVSGLALSVGGGLSSYQFKDAVTLTGTGGGTTLSTTLNLPGLTRIKKVLPTAELTLGWVF